MYGNDLPTGMHPQVPQVSMGESGTKFLPDITIFCDSKLVSKIESPCVKMLGQLWGGRQETFRKDRTSQRLYYKYIYIVYDS